MTYITVNTYVFAPRTCEREAIYNETPGANQGADQSQKILSAGRQNNPEGVCSVRLQRINKLTIELLTQSLLISSITDNLTRPEVPKIQDFKPTQVSRVSALLWDEGTK